MCGFTHDLTHIDFSGEPTLPPRYRPESFLFEKNASELLSVAKKEVHLQTKIRRNVIIHNNQNNQNYGLRNFRHLRGLRHMPARMPR